MSNIIKPGFIYEQNPADGFRIDKTDGMYPSSLTVYRGHKGEAFNVKFPFATAYIYVLSGNPAFQFDGISVVGKPGSVLSIPREFTFAADEEDCFASIVRHGYIGMIGMTNIETKGRLAYIDGCTDTTLIHPARLGDPVFNYLHFPSHIKQTQHLHPSIRFGIVARGSGIAWKQTTENDPGWSVELKEGGVFCLDESAIHSFQTTDSTMDIIAYHPDSDTGPSDQNHAMLNRTYINHGKS